MSCDKVETETQFYEKLLLLIKSLNTSLVIGNKQFIILLGVIASDSSFCK